MGGRRGVPPHELLNGRGLPPAALFALACLTVSAPSASAAGPGTLAGPFGRGAAQVWVLRPYGPIHDVVVFGHGWKAAPPSPSSSWVAQFRPWLDHLVARGSAVVFPRYQLGNGDPANRARIRDFVAGARTGYRRLGRPRVPLVAVGYSFGASLAFYYAASAGSPALPRPRAVQAVFPAGAIPGSTLGRLAPSVRVLIQVGDADTVAGRTGARFFWRWLSSHPAGRKRYEVVRSAAGLAATHAAPKSAVPAARRVFWKPLDALIAEARSG